MIRVRVAVEEPQATAMNCEDARNVLCVLVGGQIHLTEWALLEAHLRQCAECRQVEAHLRQLAAASRPVTQLRAGSLALRNAMEVARIGVTCSTARLVRRRVSLTAASREPTARATAARMIARALQAFGLRIARVVAEVARWLGLLTIPLRSSVLATAKTLDAVRLRINCCGKRTIRFRPSVHAVGVVLALAFTLYALQGTDGPQQLARPPAPPSLELGPTQLEPAQVESARLEPTRLEPARTEAAQLAPSPPAPSVEKNAVSGAPPRTDARRQSPSGAPPRVAALSPPAVSASEPLRDVASSPPTLLSESPVSAAHVVGRLSTKNLGAVQRDFIALLAVVGGTEIGRSHQLRFTAVEVVVPQSRYNEFADGLARIGSWRLEAARFPLPDAVHMSIRVSQ
jgi:hypothetical protein